jgi:hypothetical protein
MNKFIAQSVGLKRWANEAVPYARTQYAPPDAIVAITIAASSMGTVRALIRIRCANAAHIMHAEAAHRSFGGSALPLSSIDFTLAKDMTDTSKFALKSHPNSTNPKPNRSFTKRK